MARILTYMVAAIAACAFVAGPATAANIAGNMAGTVGITAGSLLGGMDNLMRGFNVSRDAAEATDGGGQGGFLDDTLGGPGKKNGNGKGR